MSLKLAGLFVSLAGTLVALTSTGLTDRDKSTSRMNGMFSLQHKVRLSSSTGEITVRTCQTSPDQPPCLEITAADGTTVLPLPDAILERSLASEIVDVRATSHVRNSLGILLQLGRGKSASYWVLTLGRDFEVSETNRTFRIIQAFCLLDHTTEMRLGDIGNPEGDSLVATLIEPRPIPASDRHLMIVFRNDCPISDRIPFFQSYSYPRDTDLQAESQAAITFIRNR